MGTAFAFCVESGISSSLKENVLNGSISGTLDVFTDPQASPTGFPFKVVRLEKTISEPEVYAERKRVCDLGYLRHAYRKADGTIGYRCPAEPEEQYVSKGGSLSETLGRKCVCNGLLSTIDLGQTQQGLRKEPALVTAGDDATALARFLPKGSTRYSAADVIRYLQGAA